MYFVYEFDLIPNKQELAPLQELIDKLMADDLQRFGQSSGAAPEARAARLEHQIYVAPPRPRTAPPSARLAAPKGPGRSHAPRSAG